MSFTPREQKMITGLRKWQGHWPKMRWGQLIIGLLGMGVAGWVFADIYKASQHPDVAFLAYFTFMYPMTLLIGISSAVSVGICLRDWHGNPQATLLLRLIERGEQGQKTSSPK